MLGNGVGRLAHKGKDIVSSYSFGHKSKAETEAEAGLTPAGHVLSTPGGHGVPLVAGGSRAREGHGLQEISTHFSVLLLPPACSVHSSWQKQSSWPPREHFAWGSAWQAWVESFLSAERMWGAAQMLRGRREAWGYAEVRNREAWGMSLALPCIRRPRPQTLNTPAEGPTVFEEPGKVQVMALPRQAHRPGQHCSSGHTSSFSRTSRVPSWQALAEHGAHSGAGCGQDSPLPYPPSVLVI